MNGFLTSVVIILSLIVLIGYFNEKVTKFTYEIALMLFSIVIGIVILVINIFIKGPQTVMDDLSFLQVFNIQEFLMEGVLCFMLFAGSCHMRLLDFKKHARPVSLLAIVATLLGALFYGLLFFAAGKLFRLNLSLPVCLMFGSIIAPTDPIAATSILKKFNLPPNISFIIEGESLLNDGVGVALFVCFSGMVTAQNNGGVISIMLKELLGAILVGIIVTAICFPLFKRTKDSTRQIFISLLAVSIAYIACEYFGFSGAIACVVCGILFSALRNYEESKGHTIELQQFDTFWEIADTLLNSILYVLLGLSFIHILKMPHTLLLSLIAIVINFISRAGSVGLSSLCMGKLPDGYDKFNFIKLLTWGGLRGGLSVALAMSTESMVSQETYYIILGGVYAIVCFTTIVQGMTMKKVYLGIERSVNGK